MSPAIRTAMDRLDRAAAAWARVEQLCGTVHPESDVARERDDACREFLRARTGAERGAR